MSDLHSPPIFTTPDTRRKKLKQLIQTGKTLRILEAHNPISALIAEKSAAKQDGSEEIVKYDGFWSSSLTDSTAKGKPDIEILDISHRLLNINDMFEVTTKPLIMDGDTGGKNEHFALNVRSLERVGVSAVVIEDKTGLKKNSLFGNDVFQQQSSIEDFCEKIKTGKQSQTTEDFMIIARVESLILNAGMDDALARAFAYTEAGADGIMIHSRLKDGQEIFEFANEYRKKYPKNPLICVPTSYNTITFEELSNAGFTVVIYANHMLRAAYMAMDNVAKNILRDGRTHESEDNCLPIKDILELIPGTK
jgi:phosphoenolpyruvate phosphomutase